MKTRSATVLETSLRMGLPAVTLAVKDEWTFAPGQYLAASAPAVPEPLLPEILYPLERSGSRVTLCPGAGAGWLPGMEVFYRGPLGQGFQLQPNTRRLGLISFCPHPARLLAPVAQALGRGLDLLMAGGWTAEAGIVCDIPPVVELVPLAGIAELLAWSDQVLVEVEAGELQRLEQLHPAGGPPGPHRQVQVWVNGPMPCAGMGQCGICAVRTRRGHQQACRSGPVFDLAELRLS